MLSNPYNYTDPAEEEMFVGRHDLLDEMVRELTGNVKRSYALIGGKRIGKTSMLLALERRLRQPKIVNDVAFAVCPVQLDLDNVADLPSENAFFEWVERQVKSALEVKWPLGQEKPAEKGMPPNEVFKNRLKAWSATIKMQSERLLRLVLLFDEFEHLADKTWAMYTYPKLRGLLQSESTPIRIVAAGGPDFLSKVLSAGSDLENVLVQKELYCLDPVSADELIDKTPKRLLEDARQAVLAQSGGHPFLIQYLMYSLWPREIKGTTVQTVNMIAADFPLRSRVFERWCDVIGQPQLRTYAALAAAGRPLNAFEIKSKLGGDLMEITKALRVLAYHGLVVKLSDDSTGPYRIAGQMFRQWFMERQNALPPSPPEPSPNPDSADLRQHLDRGEVTAFIGAGLSVGAGLPNWYDLISDLARRVDYPMPEAKWANGETLIDAAQAYINQRSLYDLVRYLQERLDAVRCRPTAVHRALARLPISLVFTANYDDLLERAYSDAGKQVHVVLEDGDIPLMRRGPDAVNIVKLYGDLDRWKSIVLARQQYEPFFLQRPQMVKLLEVAMGQSTMLYLGWSHSDPHFNLVLGEQMARFGGLMRPGYAAMFDVTDVQRRELARKQVRLVSLPTGVDRTAQLAQWLESLAPAVDSVPLRAATSQVDAPAFVPESPRVEAAAEQKPKARTPRRKAPPPERRESQVLSDSADLELRVELLDAQRTLKYTLHGGGYHYMDLGRVTLTAQPAEIIQAQLLRLSDLAHKSADRRTPEESRAATDLLEDIGSNLYEELFPPELKQEYPAIRERHAGKNLLITSDDPWIPWEIIRPTEYRTGHSVYDDPPLCETFCLARWAKGRMAPSQIAVDSIAVVQPPADLRSTAQQEIDYFAGLAAEGVEVVQPLGTVPEVEASFRAGRVRLYHFACHGNFDLTDPNESKLRLADGFLRVSQITGAKRGGLLQAQPFVFLNACHTGEAGFGLTRLGGWAPRFIESGACAFIGSLWKINSELAARFAVEFYDRLFGRNHGPAMALGQAFHGARLAIKAIDPGNPTWLAYVLYGNPNAQVVLGAPV